MMPRRLSSLLLASFWVGLQLNGRSALAFTSQQIITVTASATVEGTSASSLAIQAAPLPNPAFFGKDVVIPVTVTANPGPINTTGLTVSMMYQLVGPNGVTLLTPPVTVPVTFPASTAPSSTLNGTAIIPLSDLQPIQSGGQIYYIFVARQSGAGVQFGAAGLAPALGSYSSLVSTGSFLTGITNIICYPIGPAGGHFTAPDLFENDGRTGVTFPPGSVTTSGTVCIKQENVEGWPSGPGGGSPIEVYTITLEGTSLSQTAQLILSYATDDKGLVVSLENGQVKDLNIDANDLGIFWLGPENLPLSDQSWRVLSQSTVDKTLHTITGSTSHFSTFALFVPGAATSGAASTRPATRIIIPNGNPINRTIAFASDVDEVRIFDIKGRRIKTIHGPSPVWDGTSDSGSVVESGVYIYQYTEQGERVSGVVGVAK